MSEVAGELHRIRFATPDQGSGAYEYDGRELGRPRTQHNGQEGGFAGVSAAVQCRRAVGQPSELHAALCCLA
jgi:hypothetical protein